MEQQNEKKTDQKLEATISSSVLLVIDDEESSYRTLKAALTLSEETKNLKTVFCKSISQAIQTLGHTVVHAILLDKSLIKREIGSEIELPDEANGIEAIPQLLQIQPHAQIIVVTGSADHRDAVRAMSLGATDYVTKGTPPSLLCHRIHRAVSMASISMNQACVEKMAPLTHRELGGKSVIFQQVLHQGRILAQTDRPVLLLGETGTGKTALARWIHNRRQKELRLSEDAFFHLNVTTLAKTVIEGELFGHERGAFTDAIQTKPGFFEVAHNGTLFLDEIGDASSDLQAKLLTVIETGEYFRLGGKKKLKTNAKLIFATNKNLEAMVEDGTFREDLYMRISLFAITMPSLNQRREDIPDIIRALLPKSCEQNHVSVRFQDLPADFIEYVMRNPVKGNIRGIEHQLERLLLFSPKDESGKPILENWQGIPGLYSKKNDTFVNSVPKEKSEITLDDLQTLPFNVFNSQFPGIKKFSELVEKRLLMSATEKYTRVVDIAEALKIPTGKVSKLLKEHRVSRVRAPRSGKPNETDLRGGKNEI